MRAAVVLAAMVAAGLASAGSADATVSYGADLCATTLVFATNVGGAPTPGAVCDNNVASGAWSDSAANTGNRYLAIDLGISRSIGRVRLLNSASYGYTVKNFRWEYSTNSTNGADGTWTAVVTAVHGSDTAWGQYDFAPVSARWWRLYVVDTYAWLGLAEMEVIEASGAAGDAGGCTGAVTAVEVTAAELGAAYGTGLIAVLLPGALAWVFGEIGRLVRQLSEDV